MSNLETYAMNSSDTVSPDTFDSSVDETGMISDSVDTYTDTTVQDVESQAYPTDTISQDMESQPFAVGTTALDSAEQQASGESSNTFLLLGMAGVALFIVILLVILIIKRKSTVKPVSVKEKKAKEKVKKEKQVNLQEKKEEKLRNGRYIRPNGLPAGGTPMNDDDTMLSILTQSYEDNKEILNPIDNEDLDTPFKAMHERERQIEEEELNMLKEQEPSSIADEAANTEIKDFSEENSITESVNFWEEVESTTDSMNAEIPSDFIEESEYPGSTDEPEIIEEIKEFEEPITLASDKKKAEFDSIGGISVGYGNITVDGDAVSLPVTVAKDNTVAIKLKSVLECSRDINLSADLLDKSISSSVHYDKVGDKIVDMIVEFNPPQLITINDISIKLRTETDQKNKQSIAGCIILYLK